MTLLRAYSRGAADADKRDHAFKRTHDKEANE